jgi:hypothetical protein
LYDQLANWLNHPKHPWSDGGANKKCSAPSSLLIDLSTIEQVSNLKDALIIAPISESTQRQEDSTLQSYNSTKHQQPRHETPKSSKSSTPTKTIIKDR